MYYAPPVVGLFILLYINSHFVLRYQYGVPWEGEKGTWAGQGRAGRGERLSRKEGKVEVTGESLSVLVVVVVVIMPQEREARIADCRLLRLNFFTLVF